MREREGGRKRDRVRGEIGRSWGEKSARVNRNFNPQQQLWTE